MTLPALRVLVADVAAMDARIRAVLSGDELTFAHNLHEAQGLLERDAFDLAVVCERFDAFEFLRLAAARRARLPVVCIRVRDPLRPAAVLDRYGETVLSLGASAVADVRSGSPVEQDRVRRIFYSCIDSQTRVLKSSAYTRTLQLAAATLGGRDELARFLGVPAGEVMRWLSGAELPPFTVYCSALDIVAAGPYARNPARAHRPGEAP
jgi:hypothetical protein